MTAGSWAAVALAGPAPVVRARSDAAPALADDATTMPRGDLPGWQQTFTDDFTRDVPLGDFPAAVADRWGAYPSPWRDSTRHGVYSPADVVSVRDGVLREHIHTDAGRHKVAALLPNVPGPARGQRYGRFAVRWRADELPGYKVAWLLWPDSNRWPHDGEIDFPEMNLDTTTVGAFVHRQDASRGDDHAWADAAMDPTTWHTTVVEWSPDLVVFLLDGVEVGRTTTRIPDTPMHWVLQTETKLGGERPAASVAGDVEIDWVAVWSYAPDAGRPAGDDAAVAVSAPADDAVVSGNVELGATVADPVRATSVKWYVDGAEVAYAREGEPWREAWDSTSVADGAHRIFSKARAGDGRWITSRARTITVANR
jgi:hypothetical protein